MKSFQILLAILLLLISSCTPSWHQVANNLHEQRYLSDTQFALLQEQNNIEGEKLKIQIIKACYQSNQEYDYKPSGEWLGYTAYPPLGETNKDRDNFQREGVKHRVTNLQQAGLLNASESKYLLDAFEEQPYWREDIWMKLLEYLEE